MKYLISILLSLTFLNSCKEKERMPIEINIGPLVFKSSNQLNLVRDSGLIDSDVFYLLNKLGDTIHVEYGPIGIVNDLYEVPPPVFPLSKKIEITKRNGEEPSSEDVLFSEFPEEDEKQQIFVKNYYLYDTINNIVVKMVLPKKEGRGITGMFIRKLRDGNSFSIYADNLDSVSQTYFLKLLKTVRYKDSD